MQYLTPEQFNRLTDDEFNQLLEIDKRNLLALIESNSFREWVLETRQKGILDEINSGTFEWLRAPQVLKDFRAWELLPNVRDLNSGYDNPISAEEMFSADTTLDWLIEGVAVRNRDTIFAAPKKTWKTGKAIHMAHSLGSGVKFLGRFQCKKSRVLFMSAESGQRSMAFTSQRWKETYGEGVRSDVIFHAEVPDFTKPAELTRLRRYIDSGRFDVVFVDPLYRSTPDANSTSMHSFGGRLLSDLSKVGTDTGSTLILVHHTTKPAGRSGDPITMDDVHGAGVMEWARQWMLANRRRPYDSEKEGHHNLWFSYGGCDGFSGVIGVDIDEGFSGSFRAEAIEVAECRRRDAQVVVQRQSSATESRRIAFAEVDAKRIVEYLEKLPAGDTRSFVRNALGMDPTRFKPALAHLLSIGEVVESTIQKAKKTYPCITLAARPANAKEGVGGSRRESECPSHPSANEKELDNPL